MGVELGKPLQSWKHPKYAGIQTKSMGKVGPNHWSSNQVTLRTILVSHEDKTRNHTDPMRAQTCVILVIEPASFLRKKNKALVPALPCNHSTMPFCLSEWNLPEALQVILSPCPCH